MADAAALKLAGFAAALRFEALPADVIDAARRHLLDTVGVAIRGRAHPNAVSSLRAMDAVDGATGAVAVWGSDRGLSTNYAALVNGVACHVLEFDDTHTDAIVHGSAIIAPVVLALGEQQKASGGDLIAAFVAGWEVAARVGLASRGTFHARGFHTTSIAGVFGASAAAARLLGLSPERTAHALGLAGSQASGINEYLSNSSSAKCVHTGWSAHAGIIAATMARAGMTGPMMVFEGRDGLLRTYGERDDADVDALASGLGTRWETTQVSIKPYPCCHFAHAFIDCVGTLANRGLKASNVVSLECVVPQTEVALICEPRAGKLKPETTYAAKFSLPFLLAAKLVDGIIGHHTFEDENLARQELLDIAARVTYRIASADETPFPKTFPGWVEATLTDGRRLVERLDVNAGHPDNPLSMEDVRAKFASNTVSAMGDGGAQRLAALIMALPETSAADLAGSLSSTPSSVPQFKRKTS